MRRVLAFALVASSIVITSAGATISINGSLQLTAVVYDQSGTPLSSQPAGLNWIDFTNGNDIGSISQAGLFTAGSTAITVSIDVYDEGSDFSVGGNTNILCD